MKVRSVYIDKKYQRSILLFLFPVLVAGCTGEKKQVTGAEEFSFAVPRGFPEPVFPEGNEVTEARVELGKKLFYDPILSFNHSMSCGSCHIQQFAFGDSSQLSKGAEGKEGKRNTSPLFNLAWQNSFMRDGGVHTIELQVVAPVEGHFEMNLNINEAVKRISENEEYAALSRKAYGRNPDHFVLTRALACFQRTLVSGSSKYDRHIHNGEKLSAEEERGKTLFFSDSLGCSSCHSGFNFTSRLYECNGLYLSYSDNGRERITHKTQDIGKFRVPSLRNIAVTSPYMHDGSIHSLEGVLDHYASGGKNHPNKSEKLKGFQLSAMDKQALTAFLHCLTDEDFLKNPNFSMEK